MIFVAQCAWTTFVDTQIVGVLPITCPKIVAPDGSGFSPPPQPTIADQMLSLQSMLELAGLRQNSANACLASTIATLRGMLVGDWRRLPSSSWTPLYDKFSHRFGDTGISFGNSRVGCFGTTCISH